MPGHESRSRTCSRWQALAWSRPSIASTPSRGTAFSSFAVPTILGELKRYFRDLGWSVHVPRGAQEMALKVEEAQQQLTSKTGRPPSVQELAEYLEMSIEDVLDALETAGAHHSTSLDAPREDAEGDTGSLADAFGQEDERFELVDASVTIAASAHQLSARERHVLALQIRAGHDADADRRGDRRLADAGVADSASSTRPPARDDGEWRRSVRQLTLSPIRRRGPRGIRTYGTRARPRRASVHAGMRPSGGTQPLQDEATQPPARTQPRSRLQDASAFVCKHAARWAPQAVVRVVPLIFVAATRVVSGGSGRAAQAHAQPRSNHTSVRRGEHCIPHRSESCSTSRSPQPRRSASRTRAAKPGPWSSTAQRMLSVDAQIEHHGSRRLPGVRGRCRS